MNIDWESEQSYLFLNPRMPQKERITLFQLPDLPAHIWIATSGTETLKYVALSKEAILTSAKNVNRHINVTESDVWLHVLPDFHVGGIGIWARSYLSGSKVVKLDEWNPSVFTDNAKANCATIASLVPAQVFDLVKNELRAPESFRAILVGGGAMSEDLWSRAEKLNWPLIATYGMTECASQVATSLPYNRSLYILSHMQLRIDNASLISVKSPSLCTGYAIKKDSNVQWIDPKQDGWFTTEDRGKLSGNTLIVFGRDSYFVKIGGENVNLSQLNHILSEIMILLACHDDAAIIAVHDERLGKTIQLLTTSDQDTGTLVDAFNTRVHPFEKIRSVQRVHEIPRTPLKKMILKLEK